MAWNNILRKRETENGEPSRPPANPGNPGVVSRIGAQTLIEGTLRCQEEIFIDGTVKGELDCRSRVVITESGRVEGQIRCSSIVLSGQVTGDVKATDSVIIEATGRMVGDITTRKLTHQPGGFFEGYSHMTEAKDPPKTRETKSKKSAPEHTKEGKKA